jgi:hypothetical protein
MEQGEHVRVEDFGNAPADQVVNKRLMRASAARRAADQFV